MLTRPETSYYQATKAGTVIAERGTTCTLHMFIAGVSNHSATKQNGSSLGHVVHVSTVLVISVIDKHSAQFLNNSKGQNTRPIQCRINHLKMTTSVETYKGKVSPLQAMKAHGGCGCKGPHIHSHGTRKMYGG